MLSQRLKAARKAKKITQEQLAELVLVERSSIGKYESSNVTPSADVLSRIADVLGVSVDYLLGRTDIKNKPSAESEELASNEIVIRGRDGRYVRKKLSDDQIKALQMMVDQLPDVSDDI